MPRLRGVTSGTSGLPWIGLQLDLYSLLRTLYGHNPKPADEPKLGLLGMEKHFSHIRNNSKGLTRAGDGIPHSNTLPAPPAATTGGAWAAWSLVSPLLNWTPADICSLVCDSAGKVTQPSPEQVKEVWPPSPHTEHAREKPGFGKGLVKTQGVQNTSSRDGG